MKKTRCKNNNNSNTKLKMTLQERYQAAKKEDRRALKEWEAKRPKEAAKLVRRLAEACRTKEGTVKNWILGYRKPDDLAKQAMAKELKTTVDELFK